MANVYDEMLGAERVTNRYEDLIEQDQDAERQQIAGSLAVGSKKDPERQATVIQISERTGVPRDTADRNLETLQKPRVDYDSLIQEAPATAEFLSDVDNASVAHDDIEGLKGFEWLIKAPGLGIQQGKAPVELGTLGMKAMTQGLSDAEERRILELESLMVRPTGAEGFFEKAYVGAFKTGPQIFGSLKAGAEMGLPAAMAAGTAAALAGQAGPQVATPEEIITVPAASLAGFGAGMAGGAGKFSYELEAGNAYLEFRNIRDVDGKPMDPRVAAVAAQAVGAVNASVELVGLGVLAKSIPGGEVLLGQFTRAGVKDVLARPTLQRALGSLVARFAGVWTAEVAQEVVQEATLIIGGELAKAGAEGEFAPAQAVGERLASTAVQSAEEFAIFSLIGPASRFTLDAARANRAKDRQKAFEAIAAMDSKVRDRVPARFREFVANATQGGPTDTVYIPAERFVEYFQGAGIEPSAVLKYMPEVAAQLEERLAAGGDLAIPMADFATYIAPSEHYKGLSADLRLRPDDMTLREATEWEAQQEQLTAEAKGEAGEGKGEDPIYTDVLEQLKGTGMEEGAAEKNATLMASVFNTLAKRTGQKPEDLYERYQLKIQREGQYQAEDVLADDGKLDEVLDTLRVARAAPAGSLLDEAESEVAPPQNASAPAGAESAAPTLEAEPTASGEQVARAAPAAPLPVFTGKTSTAKASGAAAQYGASIGQLSEGTSRQLLVDPAGGYYWGDRKETLPAGGNADTGGFIIEGADKDATPALFATSKEARAAGAATPQTKSAPADATNVPRETKPSALGKGIGGGENRVRIGDAYVPGQWVVMDAAELAPSIDKAENQYRDRNRAAAQAQVRGIAAGIDFNLLGDSPLMDYGAPTLSRDGRVLGGNGRLAAIRMAYQSGTGDQYRGPLIEQAAKFGLDPAELEGMTQPVLVRVLTQDVDIQEAAIASNEGGALRMSALEQAKVDAERVGELSDFDVDADGNLSIARSRAGIRKWIGKQPATQRGALVDEGGELSAEGFTRLRNAILYRAYGDSPTLARLVEAVDPGSRNIAAALMRAAPGMAELRQGIETGDRYDLDISDDLQTAVEKLNRIKESGQSLDEALRQGDIFGEQLSGPAGLLTRFLGQNLRSSRIMAEYLDRYLELAEAAGSPKQADLMGGQAPSKESLLERAAASAKLPEFEIRPASRSQTSLFQAPAPQAWQDVLRAWTPAKGLTPAQREIETRFMNWILEDPERAVRAYETMDPKSHGGEDTEGGFILNTDSVRELSPDYRADRSQSVAVHEPASAFTKALYARWLEQNRGKNLTVLFSAGGTGAGKSSGLRHLASQFRDDADLIYDTNMNGFASSKAKIEQALRDGHDVTIVYTYRDPLNALQDGALARANRQEKEFGSGRSLPIDTHLDTHIEASVTVEQLLAEYVDNPKVRFQAIHNEANREKSHLAEFEELPILADLPYNELREKAIAIVQAAAAAGAISPRVAAAFLQSEPSPRRAAAGAGDRGQPQEKRGRRAQERPPQELIAAALERAGIDIRLVSNEEAREALRSRDLFQDAVPLEQADVDAFAASVKTELGLEEFDLRALPEGGIRLDLIVVPKGERNQGIGARAMEQLTQFADEHGAVISMSVAGKEWRGSFGTTSKARLERFYRQFGFVSNRGRNKDFRLSIYDSMYRRPRSAAEFKQSAYHGSPYDFDRFSTQHIGSGEGAQAYGWGLYFAEEDKVARGYAISLAAKRDTPGIYKNLPESLTANESMELASLRNEMRNVGNLPPERMARWRELNDKNRAYDEAVEAARPRGVLYQVEVDDGAVRRMLIGDDLLGKQPQAFRAIKKIVPKAKANWNGFDAYATIEAMAARAMESQHWDRALERAAELGIPIPKGGLTEEQNAQILKAFEANRDELTYVELMRARGFFGNAAPDRIASELLAELGIPGIKYKDANSRQGRVEWKAGARRDFYHELTELVASNYVGTHGTAAIERLRKDAAAADEAGQGLGAQYFDAARALESGDLVEAKTHNFVVFDESVIEITGKNGKPVSKAQRLELMQDWTTYDSDTPGSPDPMKPGRGSRGVTQIGVDRAMNIKLFDKADLSTLLHEGGHLYLELLRDAAASNAAARADFETILTWSGFEGGLDAWIKATPDQQRPHHEKFARGFEAYLMEGKAPSLKLQVAFARFRAWLVSIYRQVKALNVEISDPVRRVMDRLVATDEEIAAAQEQQNYEPLFSTNEEAGQSPREFEAYRKAILEAKHEAEAQLTSAVLQDITREEQAWWKEERGKIEEQVRAEVYAMPVYRALSFLQRGKNPDGSELEGVEPQKLNRAALVEAYGKDFLKLLPKPYVYSREGGVAPDVIGAMFGFDSGDAMLRELIAIPPMKGYIDRVTNERMRAKHGDIMLDGRMAEKAMDAVHNEKRADLLAAELAALQRLKLPAEAPIGSIPPSRERRLITEAARRAIAGRRVRMIRPYEFRIHEATAARHAFDEARAGNYDEAYTWKRKQLLNHELYRAAAEALQKADTIRDYMRTFDKKGRRQAVGRAGKDYLEQIDAIRERFDFRRISGPQAQKRLALAAWIDEQRAQGMEVSLPRWLMDEARRTPYQDLSYEELLGVHDTVVNIAHLAKLRSKLLSGKADRDFAETAFLVASTIEANHTLRPNDFEFAPSLRKKVKHGMARAAAEHSKMEFLFDFLDGEKANGPVWEALFKPLADAENEEQAMQRSAREAIRDIFKEYSAAERRQMFTRRTFAPEIDQSVNKATLLAIALNVGNQYNREVLLKGYRWGEGQLAALLARLDERDWRTVQATWDYIDTYWPAIKQLQRDLTGLVPEKVEAQPFTAPTGQEMKGGYYPIAYDSRLSWRQKELDSESAITDLYGGAYSRVMTRHGHTIERTNSGGKAIKLDLSVMTNHVVNVIHDLTHRRAILDVDRLVTSDAVREAIQGAAGKAMYDQLRPWLKSIAADYKPMLTVVEGVLNHLRAGASVVSMGFKITTAMVQPLGYLQSVELLGPEYSGIGLREVYGKGHPIRSIQRAKDFAFERSEQIRNRMHTFDRDVREHFKHMTETERSAPIRRSFFFLTGALDMSVSLPTWHGAYRKAMDGNADGIDAGDEPAAIDYADKILRMSQSAGGAKDLAAVQAGHPILRLFTTFYSFFSVLYNLFQRAILRTDFTKPRDLARFTASMFALWFVPAVLSEIVAGRGPDEGEDWDDYVKRSASTWALYPLQSIVFVRDLANAAFGPYGYDGPPALDALEATGRTLGIPVKILDDDQEVTRADMRALFDTAGYWGHLPSRQAWITGSYLYDWATGVENPDSVAEVAQGLAFARRSQ